MDKKAKSRRRIKNKNNANNKHRKCLKSHIRSYEAFFLLFDTTCCEKAALCIRQDEKVAVLFSGRMLWIRKCGAGTREKKAARKKMSQHEWQKKNPNQMLKTFSWMCVHVWVCVIVFSRSITSENLQMFVNKSRLALHYLMSA